MSEERTPRTQEEVERVVAAFLDGVAPGWPTVRVIPDGDHGWAFWIHPDDTTSYVTERGIHWHGSSWPDEVTYDGLTGEFAEVTPVETTR